jgi:hypothetical protein
MPQSSPGRTQPVVSCNRERHEIDFLDASSVLCDDFALTDLDERSDEDRYGSVGTDALGRVLVVL